MGSNSTSISFKNVNQDEVVRSIQERLGGRNSFVSPQVNGWVTVFDEDCDWANESQILTVGQTMCRDLNRPAIAIALISSSALFYWLFDSRGKLIDKSYRGDYSEDRPLTREEQLGLMGNPDMIASVVGQGLTGAVIHGILEKDHLFRQENMIELCEALGIAHRDAMYRDFVRGKMIDDDSANDFFDDELWGGFVETRKEN